MLNLIIFIIVILILVEMRFHPRLSIIKGFKRRSPNLSYVLWYDKYDREHIKRGYLILYER